MWQLVVFYKQDLVGVFSVLDKFYMMALDFVENFLSDSDFSFKLEHLEEQKLKDLSL